MVASFDMDYDTLENHEHVTSRQSCRNASQRVSSGARRHDGRHFASGFLKYLYYPAHDPPHEVGKKISQVS